MIWRRKKYEIIRKLHEKKSIQELEYYGTNKKQEWNKRVKTDNTRRYFNAKVIYFV